MLKKLWYLSLGTRRRAPILVLVTVLGSVVQLFSITLIFPFMLFISGDYINREISKASMQGYEYYIAKIFKIMYDFLNFSESGFVVFLGVLFIVVFLLRTLFVLFQQYFFEQERVRHEKFLSTRIFSTILFVNYSYYLKRSAAESQFVVNRASQISSFFKRAFVMVGDLVFLLFTAGLIAIIQYQILIVVGVFSIVLFFVMKIVNKKLRHYSNLDISLRNSRNTHIYQGIHYYVFSKLHGKEHYFLNDLQKVFDKNEIVIKKQTVMNLIPRNVLELLSVVVVIFFMAYFYFLYPNNVEAFYGSLTVIALAFLRVIPAIQSITTFFASLNSTSAVINKFYDELVTMQKLTHKESTPTRQTIEFNKELVLDKVSFTYPQYDESGNISYYENQPKILNQLSITIPAHSTLGIVGQTGGGKTSLVHLIMGFLRPTEGTITIDGQDIHQNIKAWHQLMGYVPQDVQLMNSTIKENIAFGVPKEDIDEEFIEQLIQDVQLTSFLKDQKQGLNTVIGDFGKRISGGQRQRLGIARALYRKPKVIIFDEATSNLDLKTEEKIQNTIYNISTKETVIIIAHRTHTLSRCNKIIALNKGCIEFNGSYKEYTNEQS